MSIHGTPAWGEKLSTFFKHTTTIYHVGMIFMNKFTLFAIWFTINQLLVTSPFNSVNCLPEAWVYLLTVTVRSPCNDSWKNRASVIIFVCTSIRSSSSILILWNEFTLKSCPVISKQPNTKLNTEYNFLA